MTRPYSDCLWSPRSRSAIAQIRPAWLLGAEWLVALASAKSPTLACVTVLPYSSQSPDGAGADEGGASGRKEAARSLTGYQLTRKVGRTKVD